MFLRRPFARMGGATMEMQNAALPVREFTQRLGVYTASNAGHESKPFEKL